MSEKRVSISLKSVDGNVLRLVAAQRKSGAVTYAMQTIYLGTNPDGKKDKKTTKGVTVKHKTMAEARAALDRLQTEAIGKNWILREPTGKPDAFDTLPVAPKAKSKSAGSEKSAVASK